MSNTTTPESDDDPDRSEELKAQRRLKELCPLLERLGVETVIMGYNGAGDEGTVDEITFTPPLTIVPTGLESALEEATLLLLTPGWELGDGSAGEFTLHVADRRMSHHHEWREITSQDTELEL